MRRVSTARVSVWVALGIEVASVRLTIFPRHATGSSREASVEPIRIGKNLWVALPTVTLAAGDHLLPGTVYAYDLDFVTDPGSHQNLGGLGLLNDDKVGHPHRHLALGYEEGALPTFVTPAAAAADLAFAHGSCRRPYAQGLDALVALDRIIEGGRDAARRPQMLFLTGDQIYADDVSDEMLAWANDAAMHLIGRNSADDSIEQLRVELPIDENSRVAKFAADRLHFPPGRRARLCARSAALTSDDNQNHALSFGEIAAHYLMSWSNVLWPPLEKTSPQVDRSWTQLYAARGADVRAYLTAWQKLNQDAHDVAGSRPLPEHFNDRIERVHGHLLLPKDHYAIDQFWEAVPGVDEWNPVAAWTTWWPDPIFPAPKPPTAKAIGVTSGIAASRFREAADDLRDLAVLMTPAWYAGRKHFGLDHDYDPTTKLPPTNIDEIELYEDPVLLRLDRLRCFYEGLPNARRALANCSTLMMFDDHEVTDDFAVTRTWRDDLSRRARGRDVMTNALAAYLVFQDWGNEPARYEGDSKNHEAFGYVRQMFTQVGSPLEHGPPDDVRVELEKLFGFTQGAPPPLAEQVTWSFSLTDPNITAYELLAFDNRTKRGYDTDESEPSDLSLEAITNQVPAAAAATSAVTIIVAPLPVVGYPPMEELAQPVSSLMHAYGEKHEVELTNAFPNVEVDYRFAKLIDDPEAWSFSTKAQEFLFDRLSSRSAVVFLSGDIHFSLTGKLTYWRRAGSPLQLRPTTRFVQLISSALKNEPGGLKQALVQLGIAEQLGAITGGPYDRLGWREGGVNGPDFDKTGASRQLIARMSSNPAVIPVRMLNDTALQQLRTPGGLHHPPDFAWRFDMVKDVRSDLDRYGAALPQLQLPAELDLEGPTRGAALQLIADHHDWHAHSGMPRRCFFYSNIGVVHFERETAGDPASPLVVVHELYAWDRSVKGPRGTTDFSRPWHEVRGKALPYARYEVALRLDDEVAPDQPEVMS